MEGFFIMEGSTSEGPSWNQLRTIFSRAIDACDMNWNKQHLQNVINNHHRVSRTDPSCFDSDSQPLWSEHLPTACARVHALRSHGYPKEALRLTVAIIRYLKKQQKDLQRQPKYATRNSTQRKQSQNADTWVEHILDPINMVFDILLEVSRKDNAYGNLRSRLRSCEFEAKSAGFQNPDYQHIPVPGSNSDETYLSLAYEVVLIGLGQQRVMPHGLYAQEKSCKAEEELIAKHREIAMDPRLVNVLQKQALLLIDGGPSSGLGMPIPPQSVPMHSFGHYLFKVLLQYDQNLAYRVGIRAMRFAFDASHGSDTGMNSVLSANYTRWFVLEHIEAQQCELVACMLSAAKDDVNHLQTVLEAAQQHIHHSTQLFKLAQDTFQVATPSDGPTHNKLVQAAFKLGLHVLRITLPYMNWYRREMVRWMVKCATEIGISALVHIMQTWYTLFTPNEAAQVLATTVMSPTTAGQLKLNCQQQEDLNARARKVVLKCAAQDPSSCALCTLVLCEKDRMAFDTAYQIVVDASNGAMNSTQLFQIARFMEHRGYAEHGYRLAVLAMRNLTLAYNQDTHPAINDVYWACALSHSFGKDELASMLPVVIKSVQCPSVLADVLRRCSLTAPGVGRLQDGKRHCFKLLSYDHAPLQQLLDATIAAYINTAHSRLTHINPRHYCDFIDFLGKARETFRLAPDGQLQFTKLIDDLKIMYCGKKKLIQLIRKRFE